jgi:hypothetical protein
MSCPHLQSTTKLLTASGGFNLMQVNAALLPRPAGIDLSQAVSREPR